MHRRWDLGQSISSSHYSEQDFTEFNRHLRKETAVLMQWFRNEVFAHHQKPTIGLELETWLVDQNFQPMPQNRKFLDLLADPLVVPELSKYNAELNAEPQVMGPFSLSSLSSQLKQTWQRMQKTMQELDGHMMMVGILPTLRDSMLSLDMLSDMDRYRALNEQVFRIRKGQPIQLKIQGNETLESTHLDIMLEAATTSFQVHIKPAYEKINETFNAAMLVSSAAVALSANSPYLFGADLWDETRIPLFEQAVRMPGYAWLDGSRQERVTFGHDYIRESLFEIFLDNLDGFPALLPVVSDDPAEWLNHVRMQNGTIWRWNRPVIGLDKTGQAHLRVEHRVMGAGPTMDDMVANLAFVTGVCHDLAYQETPPQELLPFANVRTNFYEGAKYGLRATIQWQGQQRSMCDVLLQDLLPRAIRGLRALQVTEDEIAFYMDDILKNRTISGQNGASWQRGFIGKYGKDFAAMSRVYFENQEDGKPVHTWKI